MGIPRIRLNRESLLAHLDDQVCFIRTSCELFDAGRANEAKRIALAMRILVHDTATSRSLLGQLGLKERMQFVSRCLLYRPQNILPFHGLLNIEFGPGAQVRYVPKLETEAPVMLGFAEWWNMAVLKDADETLYSRRELVLSVADSDGGAHVDAEIREAYARLIRENHVGWAVAINGRRTDWNANPILPSVRQIGHEILESVAAVLNCECGGWAGNDAAG
jgi:hypothetical protein